jgi:hypothetical protein
LVLFLYLFHPYLFLQHGYIPLYVLFARTLSIADKYNTEILTIY